MLLNDENPQKMSDVSFLCPPSRIKFLKLGSASINFKRSAEERDEVSRLVASSSDHDLGERPTGFLKKKILIEFLS